MFDDANEIYTNKTSKNSIFIGQLAAALNEEFLRKNNIRTIITVMDENLKIKYSDIMYYYFNIQDPPKPNDVFFLVNNYKMLYVLIEQSLRKGNVLINCRAGMHRSATVAAIYLMEKLKLSPDEAIAHIRKKRKQAFIIQKYFKPVLEKIFLQIHHKTESFTQTKKSYKIYIGTGIVLTILILIALKYRKSI